MENHPFPSYNHPFYPDGGHEQTFVDYGSISTLNIDVDNDGHIVTTSKHRHYDEQSGVRLVGAHLTLPLVAPCKNVFTDKGFPEQRHRYFSNAWDFKTSIVEQTSSLSRDYPDIALESSIELIEQELHCKPWDPKCFCYTKEMTSTHTRKRQRMNPNFYLDRFCELFISFPLSKQLGLMKEQVHSLPKGFCDAFHDIPPKLLFDLLEESVEQKKNEKLFFDILQGNTLAYCNIPHGQSGDGVIFYPSGPCLEELVTSVVRFNDAEIVSDETRKLYRKPALLPYGKHVDVNEAIRQISSVSYEYGDMLVATRSRYSCSFFSATSTTLNNSSEITLKAIDTLENENQAVSLVLSPFIPGEGAVVMDTGQVYIWHLGKNTDTRDVPSFAPEEKWPWYQCIYASHPRCLLIANPIEADIMDLRASGSFSRNLFSVTSKQVSTHERISAIQRNPENTHHYVIATDQSLMIMDDRFIQHPVLKWRHHLQDPVHFIEVINNAVPGCEDTLIMASGWQHCETHCFQYKWGECGIQSTFPLSGEHLVHPPVSTVLPWKVSSYDDWPLHVPSSFLPISSVLNDRLANPLIGICGIPVTFQEERKGLTVLQMSSAGDLFYQPLISNDKNKSRVIQVDQESKEPKEVKIPDADMTFLKKWINDLMDNEQDKLNEWPLKSNIMETDCDDLFSEMICIEDEEEDEPCILCNPSERNKYEQEKEVGDDKGVCSRCGIAVKYKSLARKCQTVDILCSQEIKPEIQSGDLDLINAHDYPDPLSKNLLRNWIADTAPLPLNLGNTDDNVDEGTEVPTATTDVNDTKGNEKKDEATEETNLGESSQLSNKPAEQKTFESGEGQGVDSPMKESELPALTPAKPSETIQSPLKAAIASPSKQIKRVKRKLNQSMGF